MRLLFLFLLVPAICFAQISLPEYSSIRQGANLPGLFSPTIIHFESASSGSYLEPTADGWYHSDYYTVEDQMPNGDFYRTNPGRIMRFDSTGNRYWTLNYSDLGAIQRIKTMPGGNLLHLGYTDHWYDGFYSLHVEGLSPQGTTNFSMQYPVTLPGYNRLLRNSLDVIQLSSGNLIGTGDELIWTSGPTGTPYADIATLRFGSMGNFHGLYRAASEHFYALCDSGMVEYDTLGTVHELRSFARGSHLDGYHGDTLLWCKPGWLYKADTAFSVYDSVAILYYPNRIQLRADGIWVFDTASVQQFDYSLNPLQVVNYPSNWFNNRLQGTNACVVGNKGVVSGFYQNAAWKTTDFAGNTVDPNYDMSVDSIITDSLIYNHPPGDPWGMISYSLRFVASNVGTEIVNSFGVCDNYSCKVVTGLTMLPGQTQTFYFGSTGPSFLYDGSSGVIPVNVTIFSPNEKLDKDLANNYAARSSNLVAVDEGGAAALNLSLYPNPTEDRVRLKWDSYTPDNYRLALYDLAGKQLLEQEFRAEDAPEVKLGSLLAGCYLVRVSAAEGIASFRLLVE